MVMLILMPTSNPNPIAAKNARFTNPTPTSVIMTRDSTGSLTFARKTTEKSAITMIETATNNPLSSVITFKSRPRVPITPASDEKRVRNYQRINPNRS